MPAERLQKVLASAGLGSRRAVEALIRDGRVRVDGRVAELGQRADAAAQAITVDGRSLASPAADLTLAMNKPVGVLVTRQDEHARTTVYDLLPVPRADIRSVGRLDRDTSGLLLFTTDGELQHRITHPRYGVEKSYEATLDRTPTRAMLLQLRRGVRLDDGLTAPAWIEGREPRDGRPLVQLRIHEGRNRQVRRMFEAVGCRVTALRRTAIGPVALGSLSPGATRTLEDDELARLRASVGLAR